MAYDSERHNRLQKEGSKTGYYIEQKGQKRYNAGLSARKQALIGLGSLAVLFGLLYYIFF